MAGTATATLTRNTGTSGDLVVDLSSDDLTEATVPAQVTIADGSDSAQFTVTGVDDQLADGDQSVTVTASAAGFSDVTDTLTVTDDETPELTLTIDPDSISENGGTATGIVTRNTSTTGDLVVTLVSDDTTEVALSATVTIPDGSDSVQFSMMAMDDLIADGDQIVTVTASATGFSDVTDTLIVIDDETPGLTLTIDPDSISENGGTATATLTRNTGTSGDLVVDLSSDDLTEATVPTQVIIADGSDSVQFTVTGVDDLIADGNQSVTVTASATGFSDGVDTLEVTDDDVSDGPTLIDGTSGMDILTGTPGDDIFTGFEGADMFIGLGGDDEYVYRHFGEGMDIINGFTNDLINISEVLSNLDYAGTNAIADGYVGILDVGVGTLIQIDPDGMAGSGVFTPLAFLQGVSASTGNSFNPATDLIF